jgi:nicotinamide mononucleotide transporter
MNVLEWTAAALGLLNVGLVVRRNVWNYPFGITMVTLYFFVFLDAKLYSDALLQIFFLVIQLVGWWLWLNARGGEGGAVPVGWMSDSARVRWLIGTAAASLTWGVVMARFTDAAAPMLDAAVAVTSIAAQCLMSLRRVENWVFWIAVDIAAVGLFYSRGLHATSVLYAVFLVMAVAGLAGWAKAARAGAA